MVPRITRRRFFVASAAGTMATSALAQRAPARAESPSAGTNAGPLRIGLMTYLLAAKWDLDMIITRRGITTMRTDRREGWRRTDFS